MLLPVYSLNVQHQSKYLLNMCSLCLALAYALLNIVAFVCIQCRVHTYEETRKTCYVTTTTFRTIKPRTVCSE